MLCTQLKYPRIGGDIACHSSLIVDWICTLLYNSYIDKVWLYNFVSARVEHCYICLELAVPSRLGGNIG